MSLAKFEFTNAGRALLTRAQNGETLTITKIVVGDGTASVPSDLWPLTALIHKVLDVTISSIRNLGNGIMLVEGSFNSDVLTSAFELREAGVMAHIGAEADQLYSVSNVFDSPPDHIDPAVPTVQAFKVKFIIDRIPTDSLIIQIGPSEAVLGENVGSDAVGPGPFKEAVGNVLRFKRFIAGAGMSITEDTAENAITFATKTLTTNIDLYVPESNPNAPSPD